MGPPLTQKSSPQCYTLDSDSDDENDKENIKAGWEDDIDVDSYIWKGPKKPITAGTNVISHRQSYSSNSSILHAALDSFGKDKNRKPHKASKKASKPAMNMSVEEIKKELKKVEARRQELLEALRAKDKEEAKKFDKKDILPARRKSIASGCSQKPDQKPLRNHRQSIAAADGGIRPAEDGIRQGRSPSHENKSESPPSLSPSPFRDMPKPKPSKRKISSPPRRSTTRMSMLKTPRKSLGGCGSSQQQRPPSHMNQYGDLVYGDAIDMDDVFETVLPESTVKDVKETAMILREIPYDSDYDPVQYVPSYKCSSVISEMQEKYQALFYQPGISDNAVRVPIMKDFTENTFYLFEITDQKKKNELTEAIRRLGGTVVSNLCNATRVLFYPFSAEMQKPSLFLFLTAAVGGRYLLPVSYITDSSDNGYFLDVKNFSSNKYYKAKVDIHESTMAAIKISNHFRKEYRKNRYPRFHRYNVLLAVTRHQEADVKLLLQILGAYVQPCHDSKKYLKNPLYTLCITDGNIKLNDEAKLIPRTTPTQIRNFLWNTYEQYLLP